MSKDIVELEEYLNHSNVPEKHQKVIKRLIDFYNENRDANLENVIDDLEYIMMDDSMFVGEESSAGYGNDPYVIKVHNRLQQLGAIQKQLKNIKSDWGF